MTILNVGAFVDTLDAMHTAIASRLGVGGDDGWQAPTNAKRMNYVDSPHIQLLTNGDGVLRTWDLSQEIIHENLGGKALIGVNDLWFDGHRHRQLSTSLSIVRNILVQAVDCLDQPFGLENYLLHVSDADVNTVMNRPEGQNFSYFGSQMCIMDPQGGVHFLSMDRVRNLSVSHLSYAWRATAVDGFEVSVQHIDASGQTRIEPATHYVETMGVRIPMFSRRFESLATLKPGLVNYAYRACNRPGLKEPKADANPVVDIRARKYGANAG